MKKYVFGRKYDTDTAKLVGIEHGEEPEDDPGYRFEALYVKRNGEYFLHVHTVEGKLVKGKWEPLDQIFPMSFPEARDWAELNLDGDTVEAEFGDAGEGDDEKAAICVQVSASSKARLQREASMTGKTQARIIDELLSTLGGPAVRPDDAPAKPNMPIERG